MAATANLIPATLTAEDVFTAGTTIALTQGTFVQIGDIVLEKGERITFGQGLYDSLNQAVGRFYAKVMDGQTTPAEIPGTWRIMVTDMNDRPMFYVIEIHSSEVNDDTSRADRFPLPLQDQGAKFGRKIIFEFRADDTGKTITAANCEAKISVTKQYVSND